MITRKVVLILGAGASMPFGFPSGSGLMTEIIDGLTGNSEMQSQIRGAGFKAEEIAGFRDALKNSGRKSVDAFLEHRIDFLEIGKIATAYVLLPHESMDSIFGRNETNWYEYFFNKLNATFDEFDKNSVSVLTFNYDRSLEQYLLTALQNSYGKASDECLQKLSSLPIVHLHGQLGDLPSSGGQGIEFGARPNPDVLRKAADGIKIIHEDISKNPQFQRAHDLLSKAERVCFLGFGYDRTNLERLAAYAHLSNQVVIGSALGFTRRECHLIGETLTGLGFPFPAEAELSTLELTAYTRGLDWNWGRVIDFLHQHCPLD